MWSFREKRKLLTSQIEDLYLHIDKELNSGKAQQAVELLKQIQKYYPQDARWMTRLGLAYEQLDQRCLAYNFYLQAAEKLDANAFYYLGKIEFERHNYCLAKHYLHQAAKYKSHLPYYLLGNLYFNNFEYQQAIRCYNHALQHQQIEALIPLSRIYLLLKDFNRAYTCLEQAFDQDLELSSHYLALYYLNLNNYSESKQWLIYSFQIDHNLASLEQLGQIYCSENQITYGETIIQIAQKLDQEANLNGKEQYLLRQLMGDKHYEYGNK
ncbi:MAG: tetratricopeptide repeat protein [Acinetobacter sp.]